MLKCSMRRLSNQMMAGNERVNHKKQFNRNIFNKKRPTAPSTFQSQK
jgi:hypothetical protein